MILNGFTGRLDSSRYFFQPSDVWAHAKATNDRETAIRLRHLIFIGDILPTPSQKQKGVPSPVRNQSCFAYDRSVVFRVTDDRLSPKFGPSHLRFSPAASD